ncbi:hypothetical protein GGH19_000292 [Coemansia sp. RSA 1807]|nr:hypothetical protein GGF48_000224 [Coemansia sp. RSA 921]KAJ2149399.1 hypothetical protein IW142_000126 [Coemansia sp. RSA 564]KAJ2155313.1 hypothetical protein J3F82_000278 [Coemansia sp. RSA 637]KAJ2168694.1 hypothetical protein GGH15_001161 [Coemansia sp. RSA 562]KAJ2189848.1 hypothetical protein EV181_001386 [Coemansia sp. RSA 532]KAJ2292868.1 hypothetical protein IW141_001582 [Coemansia sp. RSA 355]KAJ2408765.1 hypothetical protein J3F80_001824 [Coemansia sp. RSA 2526]KAJ2578661.1 hy
MVDVSDSTPMMVEVTKMVLESVHTGTFLGSLTPSGLPWWAVIAGTTTVARVLLTTPISIYLQRMSVKQQSLNTLLKTWQTTLQTSLVAETRMKGKELDEDVLNKELKKRLARKQSRLMMMHGCHPVFGLLLPFVQFPVWMCMSFAVRHLAGRSVWLIDGPNVNVLAAQGMAEEGMLWFANLTAVDPTYGLTMVLWTVCMSNSVLSHWNMRRTRVAHGAVPVLQRVMQTVMYVYPFILAGISIAQPSGLVFYWIVSALVALVQKLIFNIQGVRRVLGLPGPAPTNSQIIDRIFRT